MDYPRAAITIMDLCLLGPILIFDKSFLQSLNVDEAVWLDNFFLTVITPLFFVETLADLERFLKRLNREA